ncbi:hypothetical protein AYI69_g375 [Smittium culicis]|uniref:Uncharacterized protein n=1 Tax=Smittium culicis TaxID=133412 RepID=A0A1R1YTF4_9FUNG|nr:hypothetical protein AYI69_g375 [Smittium culicis]
MPIMDPDNTDCPESATREGKNIIRDADLEICNVVPRSDVSFSVPATNNTSKYKLDGLDDLWCSLETQGLRICDITVTIPTFDVSDDIIDTVLSKREF